MLVSLSDPDEGKALLGIVSPKLACAKGDGHQLVALRGSDLLIACCLADGQDEPVKDADAYAQLASGLLPAALVVGPRQRSQLENTLGDSVIVSRHRCASIAGCGRDRQVDHVRDVFEIVRCRVAVCSITIVASIGGCARVGL